MNTGGKMREVYICHNPFTIHTEFKVDGKEINNPELTKLRNSRFQTFVSKLVPLISFIIQSREFNLKFHGRSLDFEDLMSEVEQHNQEGYKINVTFSKGVDEGAKEDQLRDLFSEIQDGPFDEVKSERVVTEFEQALNSNVEVSVIATMSSGKSTLINAILGNELMPSKNMACTSSITRINNCRDTEEMMARVFDDEGKQIMNWKQVTAEELDRLNAREDVSTIEIKTPVESINTKHMNLTIIDTPGPNNSQNKSHREKTIEFIKNNKRPIILYILNATQFGINDDAMLLETVADSMKGEDRQVIDRFIFALNRVDDFDPGKEDIGSLLETAKQYLTSKGIKEPNVYPVSALIGKLSRMKLSGIDIGMEEFELMKFQAVTKKYSQMNLQQYAPLTKAYKDKLDKQLEEADDAQKLLYYSGVPAIEAAIEEYLEKYAVPAKFLNAVKTFESILNEKEWDRELKLKIHENESTRKQIRESMKAIQSVLDKGEQALEFDRKISELQFDNGSIKAIRRKLPKLISSVIASFMENDELSPDEARIYIDSAEKKIAYFESEIKVELENVFVNGLLKEAKKILEEYTCFIQNIFETNNMINLELKEDLLKNFTVKLPKPEELVSKTSTRKKVVTYEYVKRSIFNVNRWLGEAYREEKRGLQDVERIDIENLVDSFTSIVKQNFYKNIEETEKILKSEIEKLKIEFKHQRDNFHGILKKKINEMNTFTRDHESLGEEILKYRKQQLWTKNIKSELGNILVI